MRVLRTGAWLLALSACSPSSPQAEADSLWRVLCVSCHGSAGNGDGAAATGFNPRPRSFQDPAWQQSVSDDHIRTVILKGGASAGKSPLMPANPQLADKPDVVRLLIEHVRHPLR
jgi:hypothetical protein